VTSAERIATTADRDLKAAVEAFWDAASCGEIYAEGEDVCARLRAQARRRYELEPYIFDFARFAEGAERDLLEIGVGMGADHVEWAKSGPRALHGIDLTPRAVDHTKARLLCEGLSSDVRVADAEALPFADASFDLVYSWGVLHHSPDTPRALREVHRVLRPGGVARIMIYHKWSLVGYMLWARYALLTGQLTRSLADVYAHHLESPGTKAYTPTEARAMLAPFREVTLRVQLSFGDLLEGAVGQRHGGALLRTAKALWPRPILRTLFVRHGLFLLADAVK
jgi:ubiquinone/menaquinone biosynthesis C-methylase UbiE